MKFLIVVAIVFYVNDSYCQDALTSKKVKVYLENLNNLSAGVNPHYAPTITLDTTAQFLYSHANRFIINKLMKCLEDKNKALACHVLLSKLLLINASEVYRSSESEDSTFVVTYKYNDFTWKEIVPKNINGSLRIEFDTSQIRNLIIYWTGMKKSAIYQLKTVR